MSRKRTGLLVGLLAAGAAAGAAGAYAVRRRNRSSWEEYESPASVAEEESIAATSTQPAADEARDDVAVATEKNGSKASDMLDHAKSKADRAADKATAGKNGRS